MVKAAHIAFDPFRHQVLGRERGVREHVAQKVGELFVVDLGDHFLYAELLCVHGEDNVFFIDVGKRDKAVRPLQAALCQHRGVSSVGADHVRHLQKLSQLMTTIMVALDDGHIHAGALQKQRQIDSN